MKDGLNIGKFTELTGTEAEMVDGGSIYSAVLDTLYVSIPKVVEPFPFINEIIVGVAYSVLMIIEAIAAPMYGWYGLKFRG